MSDAKFYGEEDQGQFGVRNFNWEGSCERCCMTNDPEEGRREPHQTGKRSPGQAAARPSPGGREQALSAGAGMAGRPG